MSDYYQGYGQNPLPRRGRHDPSQDDDFLAPNSKRGSQRSSVRDSGYGTGGSRGYNSPPPHSPISFDGRYDHRHTSDGGVSDDGYERYRREPARDSHGSDFSYSNAQYDQPSHGRGYQDFDAGIGSQHNYREGVDGVDEVAELNSRIQDLLTAKEKADQDYHQLQERMDAAVRNLRCSVYDTTVASQDQKAKMELLLEIIEDKRVQYFVAEREDDVVELAAVRRSLAEKVSSLLKAYFWTNQYELAATCIEDYIPREMRNCPEMREAHFWLHKIHCCRPGDDLKIMDAIDFHDNARTLLQNPPDTDSDATWALRNSEAYFTLVLGRDVPRTLAAEISGTWGRCSQLRPEHTTELAKQIQTVAAAIAKSHSNEGPRHALAILKQVCHSNHFAKIEASLQRQIRLDLMVAHCTNEQWTEAHGILKALGQQPSASTRHLDPLGPDLAYYKLLIYENSKATWPQMGEAALDYFKAHGYTQPTHLKYAVGIMAQYSKRCLTSKKEQAAAFDSLRSFANHAKALQKCAVCTNTATQPQLLRPLYDVAVSVKATGKDNLCATLRYVVNAAPTRALLPLPPASAGHGTTDALEL
jgi:hypothetical protein